MGLSDAVNRVFRNGILHATTNPVVRRTVERYGMQLGAARFVAGESLDQAIQALRRLEDMGFKTNTTIFGEHVFDDDNATFQAVLKSLETFEQAPEVFYPYTSKYDAYLAGKTALSAAELRGLQLFNDEKKGNCASCHISQRAKDGAPPQFSDFGLIAIGVPRNRTLAVNRDPRFFDLGACGPERTDLDHRAEFCGLFRTPTLRNVALKKTFFHNGVYHSLEDVLRFYARRDTNPQEFYPVVKGKVKKFDDLPQQYWANLNTEPPFDRKPGDAPVFSDAEIKDVMAFLDTLTDGWQPPAH